MEEVYNTESLECQHGVCDHFTIVLASSMVTLPEIWKAQLQLLAGFVSRDVVGGGAPLKLEKQKTKTRAKVNYDNAISTKALVRNHRALFCSSQTLNKL